MSNSSVSILMILGQYVKGEPLLRNCNRLKFAIPDARAYKSHARDRFTIIAILPILCPFIEQTEVPASNNPRDAVCDVPFGRATGSKQYFKNELLAAFMLLLISLPLISMAIGYPPLAGLIAAIISFGLMLLVRLIQGVPFHSLFKPYLSMTEDSDNTCVISADESAIFASWNSFRKAVEKIGLGQQHNVVIDLSNVENLDHGVMTKLVDLQRDFKRQGLRLDLAGLDDHLHCSEQSRLARTVVLNKN